MSATSYGWLVLAFPLAGTLIIALGWRVLPGRLPGWIATSAIFLAFLSSIGALLDLLDRPGGRAAARRHGVDLRLDRQLQGRPRDPGRPAVGVHVPGGQRRLVPDPPLLGRLHGRRPRLRALLRLPELLRLLDAAAGPGRQLRDPDRRLGVRRRGVVPPDLLLVPPPDRGRGRHQGVRDQRDRRRRPRDRRVPDPRQRRLARLPAGLPARRTTTSRPTTARSSGPASCCWWARSRSPPSCRSTPGSRTPWRAPPRSPR